MVGTMGAEIREEVLLAERGEGKSASDCNGLRWGCRRNRPHHVAIIEQPPMELDLERAVFVKEACILPNGAQRLHDRIVKLGRRIVAAIAAALEQSYRFVCL